MSSTEILILNIMDVIVIIIDLVFLGFLIWLDFIRK